MMKEPLDLPSGSRTRKNLQKQPLELPGGSRPSKSFQKEPIDMPENSEDEHIAGGIMGLHDNISATTRPLGLLSKSKNLIRHGETAATTRPGRQIIGEPLDDGQIKGLATLYKDDGTKKLVASSVGSWKAYDGDSWDEIYSPSPGHNLEGAMMRDMLILTNGEDEPQKYEGGSSTSDLGGDPPKSPFILSEYSRVFMVNLPHQLKFTDVGDAEEWEPEEDNDAGVIPINDKDGDKITWLHLYKSNIIIWKRHSLHELHGPELGHLSDRWKIFNAANVGTPNGRTVVELNGIMYWLSDTDGNIGIVQWGGGHPELISQPIKETIKSINWDYIDQACATTWNGYYVLAIPTGSSSYADTLIFYNTYDESFWLGDGWYPTSFTTFRIDEQEEVVFGDSNGSVYKIGGHDDDGQAIMIEAIIGPSTMDINTRKKRVRRCYLAVSIYDEEEL